MIVQWCVKGLHLPSDATATAIVNTGQGLLCNWWRRVGTITPAGIRTRLTEDDLERHVNHFDATDSGTGETYGANSPFISLSAGVVERDAIAKTNIAHRARRTAFHFGTGFGAVDHAYLFTCWVLLAPRRAVEIEGVAEEVRDLNTYRRFSPWQTEGEITAKVSVPDNQIRSCERLEFSDRGRLRVAWRLDNPRFTSPERLSNVRGLIS
ncbi:hypothetical protein V5P93_002265 [Actinokineospora auranticolor]|uniref:hypothetical protein n=1 Tax=Actinokineospora auranticolor TaxID=155976 RepID=UPI000CEBCAD1|nr:hypothetical protein [Actinokineospora auranticolor]